MPLRPNSPLHRSPPSGRVSVKPPRPETPLRASSCTLIVDRYSNPQFFYQEWYRLELERQVS